MGAKDAKDGSLTKDSPDKIGEDTTTLQQNVGLIGGISFIVGTMIGSGIFVSPKGVLRGAGSSGLSLVIWLLGGVVSMFGAISYVELGSMITKSGAEYVYLLEAFHPVFAYLFSFMATFLIKPAGVAVIGLTCAEYLMTLFFDDGCGSPPELTSKLLAVAMICYTNNLNFEGTTTSFGSVALGFYSSMFAYDGWNNLNFIIEELQEPHKNLPRAIIIDIPLVTIVYVLTNVSYFTVLSPEELLESPAVAKSWAEVVMPQFAWMMPLFVALSTFGATNGSLFCSGRLVFAAAREGHTIKLLSFIHVNQFSPAPAIIFTVLMATAMMIPSDIDSIIDFFSFAAWMFYFLVFVGLIYMRWSKPDAIRPFKVPLILPILAAIFAIFLVLAPIISDPQMAYLYALLFIIGGLVLYFPFVHFNKELPFMEHFNIGAQQFLQVAPGQEHDDKDDISTKDTQNTTDANIAYEYNFPGTKSGLGNDISETEFPDRTEQSSSTTL